MPTLLGRLLVVDDEPEITAMLQTSLEAAGYQVQCANTAAEAQSLLKAGVFDILMTDLMLPGADGFSLLKSAQKTDPLLVGVVMTGRGTLPSAIAAMREGACDYLQKPFDLPEVEATLARAMQLSRLRRDNATLRAAALNDFTQIATFTMDPPAIIDRTLSAALEQTGADEASLLLRSPDDQELYVAGALGPDRAALTGRRWPVTEGVAGYVARTAGLLRLEGPVTDPRFQSMHPRTGLRVSIVAPMTAGGRVTGVLCVNGLGAADQLSPEHASVLAVLANTAAAALDYTAMHMALRASETRYRDLIEQASDGIALTGPDGSLMDVNSRCRELLGYTREEMLRLNFQDLVVPADRDDVLPRMRQAQPGQIVLVESTLQRRDGARVPTEISFKVLADGNTQAIIRDISERRQAETRLRDAEARFRLLVERQAAVTYVISARDRFETIYVSPQIEELLGYTTDEWLADSGIWQKSLHPEDRDRVMAESLRSRGTQTDFNLEYRLFAKDGRVVWVHDETAYILDEAGQILYGQGIEYDITERKQAEAERERLLHDRDLRVRELTCLHRLSELLSGSRALDQALLDDVVNILPEGWQHSATTAARVSLGSLAAATSNWTETPWVQSARFACSDGRAGSIEVAYLDQQPADAEGPFSAEERSLLDSLAEMLRSYADRQYAEQAEREQRALAEALRDTALALNSSLDSGEILGRILDIARRVVPYESGNIMLVEDGQARIVHMVGYAERGIEAWARSIKIDVSKVYYLERVIMSGQTFAVNDTRADPRWVVFPETAWIRSNITAPIRLRDSVTGVISLESAAPDFFGPDDSEHLLAFADQVAAALEGARLVQETRGRLRQLEVVAQISAALRTAQNRAEMPAIILEQMMTLFSGQAAMQITIDPIQDEGSVELARGAWLRRTGERVIRGQGLVGQVLENGQPCRANDLAVNPGYVRLASEGLLEAGMFVPLIAHGRAIGALALARTSPFAETDLRLLAAIADMATNALQRAMFHDQTELRLERLQALRLIDEAITSSFDLNVTLRLLLGQAITHLRVDAADILLLNQHTQTLTYGVGQGFRSSAIQRVRLRLGEGVAGRVALDRKPMVLPRLENSGIEIRRPELITHEKFVSYVGVPLVAKGQVKGVLEVLHRSALSPTPDWQDFLETLAGQSAIAVDNIELFNELQRSNTELELAYDTTLEGWSRALDLRDKETEGHTRRVTEMVIRLARAYGINDHDLVHLRRGALLHDIGKMGIPDSILLKPGPLSNEEWQVMRQHPTYAQELLAPIAYLTPALDIPYCHHEKWDGTGYPRGLKGEQIPLAARLFAIVDVWDALSSDRPYRPAWQPDVVRNHLASLSGTHFDPQVVQTFLGLRD